VSRFAHRDDLVDVIGEVCSHSEGISSFFCALSDSRERGFYRGIELRLIRHADENCTFFAFDEDLFAGPSATNEVRHREILSFSFGEMGRGHALMIPPFQAPTKITRVSEAPGTSRDALLDGLALGAAAFGEKAAG
jgi:hypothetical protein